MNKYLFTEYDRIIIQDTAEKVRLKLNQEFIDIFYVDILYKDDVVEGNRHLKMKHRI